MRIPSLTELTPAASSWPVSLELAKQQLKINPEMTTEDIYISRLAAGVCQEFEARSGYLVRERIVTETWPCLEPYIKLYCYPVLSVEKVEYMSALDNTWKEIAPTDYDKDLDADPGMIIPLSTVSLMARRDAVRITYKAGYNNTVKIPENFVTVMLAILGRQHYMREDEAIKFDSWADRTILSLRRIPPG